MGAKIRIMKGRGGENIVISGVKELHGGRLRSFGDHRTAMSMIVAALCADSPSRIDDINCISKSFPDFLKVLKPILRYR